MGIIKDFCVFLLRNKFRFENRTLTLHNHTKVLPGSVFKGYNSIGENSTYFGQMGHDTYIGSNSMLYANIGNFTSIGDCVKCVFGSHPTKTFVSTSPVFYSLKKQTGRSFVRTQKYKEVLLQNNLKVPVIIGNDVWIGSHVLLVGNIKIADGAVIAAGSVVTHDIEPYSVVAGVPAKKIKFRHSKDQIKQLLNIQWWNKSDEWIIQNIDKFTNIDDFVNTIEAGRK